jgi:hypothetical protein
MAEMLIKLFSKEIQPNLFPSNEFYKSSKLDGGVDINAKTVDVPQAGAKPTIIKNPTSFPLTIGSRTDDVLTYSVDQYVTAPTAIQDVNEMVISYSKRADVLKDHALVLNSRVSDEIAVAWSPSNASQISRTSGAADGSALATGATGTRNSIVRADIALLATKFDRDDVPMSDRFMLVPADLYAQLLKIDSFINFDYVNRKPTVDGQIGEIFGMKVFKRSRAVTYTNAGTPVKKEVGAATAVTDNLAILAWASGEVRRAEGLAKIYSDIDNPAFVGSVFNAAVRSGGTFARTDQKGVYSLVQTV